MNQNIKVIQSNILSAPFEPRYIVIDAETGEILDDAQGFGYKTIGNAYRAYRYKMQKDMRKENAP